MGILASQTNGVKAEKKIRKEIGRVFRESSTLLDAIRHSLENVIAQARNDRYSREAVIRGLESIREKELPKASGQLSALISQIDGLINVVVGKGKKRYQTSKELVGKAAEILRIQWDKDIMNLLFEVRNNRYTQAPKSEKLRDAEKKAEKREAILRALRLFAKEGGASSVEELNRKLKKSTDKIIEALDLVVEASKFF